MSDSDSEIDYSLWPDGVEDYVIDNAYYLLSEEALQLFRESGETVRETQVDHIKSTLKSLRPFSCPGNIVKQFESQLILALQYRKIFEWEESEDF